MGSSFWSCHIEDQHIFICEIPGTVLERKTSFGPFPPETGAFPFKILNIFGTTELDFFFPSFHKDTLGHGNEYGTCEFVSAEQG